MGYCWKGKGAGEGGVGRGGGGRGWGGPGLHLAPVDLLRLEAAEAEAVNGGEGAGMPDVEAVVYRIRLREDQQPAHHEPEPQLEVLLLFTRLADATLLLLHAALELAPRFKQRGAPPPLHEPPRA